MGSLRVDSPPRRVSDGFMTRELLILALVALGVATPLLGMRMPSLLWANGERAVALFAMLAALGLVAYSHREQMRSVRWEMHPADEATAQRLLAHAAPLPLLRRAPRDEWTLHERSGAAECQRTTTSVSVGNMRTNGESSTLALGCLGPIAYRRQTDSSWEAEPGQTTTEDFASWDDFKLMGVTAAPFSCNENLGTPEVAVDERTRTYAIRCAGTGAHIALRETRIEGFNAPEVPPAWASITLRSTWATHGFARAERIALVGVLLAFALWVTSLRRRGETNVARPIPLRAPYRVDGREAAHARRGPSLDTLRLLLARRALSATALVIASSAPLIGMVVDPPRRAARATPQGAVCLYRNDVAQAGNAQSERPLRYDAAMQPHCGQLPTAWSDGRLTNTVIFAPSHSAHPQ